MKLHFVVIAVAAVSLAPLPVFAGQPTTTQALPSTDRVPGVDLAEGLSQLTGVAISPLLGVSSVGAWRYYHTPEPLRDSLPWFCHPYVWRIGFFLLGLCFLKDFFGTAAPPLIKKPLDVAELFENKLSGLIACSAFLPFIVSQMTQHMPEHHAAQLPTVQLAWMMGVVGFDARILTIPLAVVAFFVVWLACHAINVLIALCPFGFIDALLKLIKVALLSTVVGSAFINPYFGAAVSVIIILVASLLAPWAFRLTVFGTLFGMDVLFPRRGRRLASPTEPHAFLAHALANAPVRTYGRLVRDPRGAVIFSYRPWLVLPRRSVTLPSGGVSIAKGFLFPSLLHSSNPQQRRRMFIMFLPRYRSHEQTIATYFAIADIQDGRLMKGFRAVRAWLGDMLTSGRSKYAEFRNTPTV
jgi:hypothetical protein